MSDIRRARSILQEVVPQVPPELGERINVAIRMLARNAPGKPVAPRKRRPPVTAERAAAIREYINQHPTVSLEDVARIFNCNAGRVSEALNKLR